LPAGVQAPQAGIAIGDQRPALAVEPQAHIDSERTAALAVSPGEPPGRPSPAMRHSLTFSGSSLVRRSRRSIPDAHRLRWPWLWNWRCLPNGPCPPSGTVGLFSGTKPPCREPRRPAQSGPLPFGPGQSHQAAIYNSTVPWLESPQKPPSAILLTPERSQAETTLNRM
jgi:hypothetical protein